MFASRLSASTPALCHSPRGGGSACCTVAIRDRTSAFCDASHPHDSTAAAPSRASLSDASRGSAPLRETSIKCEARRRRASHSAVSRPSPPVPPVSSSVDA